MNPSDAFHRILESLHEAALDDAHWPTAAALIEEACGCVGNMLVVGERFGDEVRVTFSRYLARGEPRQDLMRNYFEVYASRDEMPLRLLRRPLGALNHIPDLYTEKERRTSLAYNEHLLRSEAQNGLVVRLDELDSLRVAWSLGDPVGSDGWRSDHVRLIGSLAPHVRQLVRVRQALADADALSAGLAGLLDTSGIGVLHLDRGGRVLAANAPALEILRGNKGLSDRGGTLHAQLQADDGRLQRLLKRALPVFGSQTPPTGGSMTIQRPSLSSRLELHVHPMNTAPVDWGRRLAALVLVVDPERRPHIDPVRLSLLLGLTPSEGRVSALLAEGRPVREIAATTGYKESYVRWLLYEVYKKQGVSGQVALVHRVLTAYGFPRR